MSTPSPHEITDLVDRWSKGDQSALDRLVPMVEADLRRVARSYLNREQRAHDLQTTAIINEVFLRLINASALTCRDRIHFFTICAQMMRRILVDHARARRRLKRGAGTAHLGLDEGCAISPERLTDVIAIDEALISLSRTDPRKSKVVELRFFGGLNVEETAEALNISNESVKRDWRLAKLWLLRELGGSRPDSAKP